MGWLLVVISTVAALLVGIPRAAEPGRLFGIGGAVRAHHARGFRAPHSLPGPSRPSVSSSFLRRRRLARRPFGPGIGVVVPEPDTVHVVAVPVPAAAPVAPPAEADVPDSKFVFAPSPLVEPAPGRQAVIVQHGSRIEVTSFPVDR